MAQITQTLAKEILDSRGIPTIETTLTIDNERKVTASVPAGTSTGTHEAVELRDNDQNRFYGKGVLKAVANVNAVIGPAILGKDPTRQTDVDQILVNLDGSLNKSRLGANAILSVSTALCKAGALAYNLPVYKYLFAKYRLAKDPPTFPTPTFNVINGGKHGAGNLDFQEFHIIPSTRMSYSQALQTGVEVYHAIDQVLTKHGAIHSVGIEGGFAPNLYNNSDALELILEAIRTTKYKYGEDVFLGLDVAASNFYKGGKYQIKDRKEPFSTKEFIDYYKGLNDQYHLYTLEDPLFEDDWGSWTTLTKEIGTSTVVIGDDLLTTNKERTLKGIAEKCCTGILAKPNQIGTISQAIEVITIAKNAGWQVVVSHRSGETNDDFIADFAVGVGAHYTKFGAPARGERIAKYNRLLDIESELTAKPQAPQTNA
ncbi:MAG: phosphopyruvate hydratase [Candidatus Chisholmbacteria bacterium RIFCSPLOWO2_01_FULL_50_28]|uniref:Enolase n=1 Tax=Candidatus Chisholmbacteria bacterium RIFCSPHIGHO2_01_FULL_52_32 TaxID=1797591 RepID=A0A1G1VT41_9BACT|nr:MAG: phosphopyruvate hydratase [Candidatus Chisholmbacteria bacterium RIFCSPHIGHO2_01_FULL_52_32]OGY20252.1 MAG: phosphopyruvate hydratase [Candidatus Chisholmbacteria bacterium RIFCSPLOWO2_01_FULL_50_28]